MKVIKIKNPTFKIYNPSTWSNFIEFSIEKHDFIISKGNSNFEKTNINIEGNLSICFDYKSRKHTLLMVEKFLFPGRRKSRILK